jgi:hypothetical protein
MARITPSAVGDRQIFPKQTNNTLRIRNLGEKSERASHSPFPGIAVNVACLASSLGEILRGSKNPVSGIKRRDYGHKSHETVVTTLR